MVPIASIRASTPILIHLQIKDLNSGTFGFVQLALDRTTGRQCAIKFIERGDKASTPLVLLQRAPTSRHPAAAAQHKGSVPGSCCRAHLPRCAGADIAAPHMPACPHSPRSPNTWSVRS